MSTDAEIEYSEAKRLSETCSIQQTLQYEPIPFHRTLTVEDVRHFFDTGMMPTDESEDETDREPEYDESTWTDGGGVSVRE
jgi:hypothetical protein